jgi:hypothetical protein
MLSGTLAHLPRRILSRQLRSEDWEGEMRIRLGVLCLLLTATTASAQSLEQQAICAKQAKIAFEDYNADYEIHKLPKPVTIDYQSHYNTKLNKCLIDIEATQPMGQEFLTTAVLNGRIRATCLCGLWLEVSTK